MEFFKKEQNKIHYAEHGVVECTPLMGAAPNVSGNRKLTALHIAVWRGHEDTVRQLLESGAAPNIIACENKGDFNATPLYFAKKGSGIYQLLIQFGGKEK